MNTYKVCAKCGHVGKGKYIENEFAVIAESKKDAANIVKNYPRIKRHHKDVIRYVEEISEEQYKELLKKNIANPYFHCKNIQEQRIKCKLDVKTENRNTKSGNKEEKNKKKMYYNKKEIRNQKKYFLKYI